MKRTSSEQEYRKRIARVVAAMVADPMAPHTLETLAAIAHFSPFHFHRIYQGITGETVAATVRRLRLARAAILLGERQASVTEIALATGYDSPQAFTRAFRNFTGNSPRGFQRRMDVFSKREDSAAGALSVQLIERPALRIHALRHRGPNATIPHTHRRLRAQLGARTASQWLGVVYGDGDDAAQAGADANIRYYAGAVLDGELSDADQVEVIDLPGGTYASHTLVGPYAQISTAMFLLYSEWLPSSGLEPEDRPALEHYLNSPRIAAPEALRTDLLIPVRLLSSGS